MPDTLSPSGSSGSSSFDPYMAAKPEGPPDGSVDSKDLSFPQSQDGPDSRPACSNMDSDNRQFPSQRPEDPDAPWLHPHRKRKRSLMASDVISPVVKNQIDIDHIENGKPPPVDFPAKRAKLDGFHSAADTVHSISVDRSKLPKEVWHHIFTFLPPVTLGTLLRVNKAFNFYLTPSETKSLDSPGTSGLLKSQCPNSIWSASRKLFHPGMPRPLENMTELDMWKLVRGGNCQFCGKAGNLSLFSESSPWEAGPGQNGVRIVWPFGIRSCGECLTERTEKEMDLMLSSLPTFLVPALSFALVTPTMHVIPSVTLRSHQPPPGLVMTKHYYKPQIDDLKCKFEEVKALGTATVEEWIKGLESKGKEKLADFSRWELWESNGGLRAVRAARPHDQERYPHRISPMKSGNKALSSMETGSGNTTPLTNGKLVGETSSPFPSATNTYGSRLPPRPLSPYAQQPFSSTAVNLQQQPPRSERSLRDVNEAKALRRAEIERRCSELDPPLTAAVLSHMDSFSAAIQIPHPFTDRDWEILKPRLLAQRDIAEQREQERVKRSELLQAKSEERRQQEAQLKEAKEMLDREWEEVQRPIRDRMALYADEIINEGWRGGSAVNKEKSPKFAADVLMYVRNKFYAHIEEEDALARASGKPIPVDPPNAPPTRKLILENMKWVFDTKIKPLTEQFQKELFLCNGCENNSKFYGFEGVVQHYAAKHTNVLSLGSVVVHWRAEWPEKPPFHPNPNAAKALFHAIPHGGMGQGSGYAGHHGGPGMYLPGPDQGHHMPPDMPPVYPHQSPGPYGRPPYSAPYPYAQGPYRPPSPNMGHYYSSPQAGYGYPPPQPTFPQGPPFEQHVPPAPMYGSPYLGHAYPASYQPHDSRGPPYPPPGYGPPPPYVPSYQNGARPPRRGGQSHPYNSTNQSFGLYQNQLDEVARTAREVWNGTSGVKDLPNSVRAYVLIYHVVCTFREQFCNEPTIALFADGLNNHPQMKPLRNLSGLTCRACIDNDYGRLAGHFPSRNDRKLYTLPALVSHFQSVHIERTKSSVASQTGIEPPRFDWKVNMVDLPEPSVVASLLHAPGMDEAKLKLVADAFPGVFPSPLPVLGPATHLGRRTPLPHHKPRLESRDAKRHGRGPRISNRNDSLVGLESRQADVNSGVSSPNQRVVEVAVDDFPRFTGSPGVDTTKQPLETPRNDEYDPHRPAFVEPVRDHYGRVENRRPRPQSEREGIPQESSQEPGVVRSYDYSSSHARPVSIHPFVEESDDAHAREPPLGSDRHQYGMSGPSDYPSRPFHRERSIRPEYLDVNPGKQQISDYKSGSGKPRSPQRKASEDGEVCEEPSQSKGEQPEKGPPADEISAAERFLSSFVPGQDADVYQPNGHEQVPRVDEPPGGQWVEHTDSEDRRWRHDEVSGGTAENSLRGTPARSTAHNGWTRRNKSPSSSNYRDYESRQDIRGNAGVPSSRNQDERSPEPGDPRQGRKTTGYQESRRPHSRFDRYEAQRQGSLRPRSRSPSVRESIPVDSSYYGEHSPQIRARRRPVYSGQAPEVYRDRGRFDDTVTYARVPQQGQYQYIDDPRYMDTQYDSSIEYIPVRVSGREPQETGAYYVERTTPREIPREYVDYDVEYPRQQVYERSGPLYRASGHSQNRQDPSDVIRRPARFR
ncbi:hypothetical protein VTN00DRAFT_2461 [Thermoascus crustaceus]|uniref:uncharacterized protein n=1 Tax=Thermoascus crustaceus TaxID=5088 RepID=UPI003744717F